jgi:hypothetical protein
MEQKQAVTTTLSYFNISFDFLTTCEWNLLSQCLLVLESSLYLTSEVICKSQLSISKVMTAVKELYVCL